MFAVGGQQFYSFIIVVYGENIFVQQGDILLVYCKWPLGKIVCQADSSTVFSCLNTSIATTISDMSVITAEKRQQKFVDSQNN